MFGYGYSYNKILPRLGGLSLASIFSTYGFTNMWSAENITDGADLIAHDYAGEHDLSSNGYTKPTITASNADAGNRQTLDFNGLDMGLYKAVSDWRGSDTTGVLTFVTLPAPTKTNHALCSSDETSSTRYWGNADLSSSNYGRIYDGSTLTQWNDDASTLINGHGIEVTSVKQTGSGIEIYHNGIKLQTSISNTNWIGDVPLKDSITIGMLIQSGVPDYGQMDWCMSGYHSPTGILTESQIIDMHQDLMTYYGMNIQLALSQLDQLNGIVNGWGYNDAFVQGTTTRARDLKGELYMLNPAAINQPALFGTYLEFDGINHYLWNNVSDYLIGKSTGVVHVYMNVPGDASDATRPFATSNSTANNDTIVYDSGLVDEARALMVDSTVGVKSKTTTATYSGYTVISFVQDGTDIYILINGVKITLYSLSTWTTEWFNTTANRDNISIGASVRLNPAYKYMKWKGTFITDYVSEAIAIEEAKQILNSGL